MQTPGQFGAGQSIGSQVGGVIKKAPGLLKSIGKALIEPVTDYGKMVGEGLYQGGRVLTDKNYRGIVKATNSGTPLT